MFELFAIASIDVGSITSRCSGNEPALLPEKTGGKTELERTAEIEPSLDGPHF